jgi:hypothetical protein
MARPLALTTLSNRCSGLWVPFLGGLTLDPFTGIKGLPRSISDATGLAAQAHRRVVRHYRLPEAWVHLCDSGCETIAFLPNAIFFLES